MVLVLVLVLVLVGVVRMMVVLAVGSGHEARLLLVLGRGHEAEELHTHLLSVVGAWSRQAVAAARHAQVLSRVRRKIAVWSREECRIWDPPLVTEAAAEIVHGPWRL